MANKWNMAALLALLGASMVVGSAAPVAARSTQRQHLATAPADITPYAAPTIAPVGSTAIATVAPATTITAYQTTPIPTVAPAATIGIYRATPVATIPPAATLTPYEAEILRPYQARPLTPFQAPIIKAVAPGAKITPFIAPPITRVTASQPSLYIAAPLKIMPAGATVPLGLQSVGDANFALQTNVGIQEGRYLGCLANDNYSSCSISFGGFGGLPRSGHPSLTALSEKARSTQQRPTATGTVLLYQSVTLAHAGHSGHVLARIPLGLRLLHPTHATVTVVLNTGHGLLASKETFPIAPTIPEVNPSIDPTGGHLVVVTDNTFEKNSAGPWPTSTSSDTSVTVAVTNERYTVGLAAQQGVVISPNKGQTMADGAIGAAVELKNGAQAGVVARYSRAARRGYACLLANSGTIACLKQVGGRWTRLGGTTTKAMAKGQTNSVDLLVHGPTLILTINRQPVVRYTDPAPLPAGGWGVIAQAGATPATAWYGEIAVAHHIR